MLCSSGKKVEWRSFREFVQNLSVEEVQRLLSYFGDRTRRGKTVRRFEGVLKREIEARNKEVA